MTPRRPRVSVVMPVYNAADTIDRALQSALGQTYEDLEVVVVDNASTDGTPDIVRGYGDPRIVLHENPRNIGAHKNANRSTQLSHGELLKFLHADDFLYPHCVERMVELMDRSPRIGLVFARRRIEIGDESDPDQRMFREVYSDAVRQFGGVQEINDGPTLLRRWLSTRFETNWLGEPSSVMMRRQALERIGLFNPRVRMLTDAEMWARTMTLFDVGFIDEELSTYRFHAANLTMTQGLVSRWLDRLWLLEGLAESGDALSELTELHDAIAAERVYVAKAFVRIGVRSPKMITVCLRDALDYAVFLTARRLGDRRPLHPPLAAVGATLTSVDPAPRLARLLRR